MADRFLNHFTTYAFTPAFWAAAPPERDRVLADLAAAVPTLAEAAWAYSVFPVRPECDLLIWCAVRVENADSPADFLTAYAARMAPFRAWLQPTAALWGFTRPSQYHPGKSPQLLDPFDPVRRRYLVIYPFSKTNDWYQLGPEARQGMMNEHIRVGKEYPDITQLLLYCTGLADQEFVVVYETAELPLFSELVVALRSTDGRPYTLRDTPITTAIWRPLHELVAQWR